MRAHSADFRRRVLAGCDAGMSCRDAAAAKYSVSSARV